MIDSVFIVRLFWTNIRFRRFISRYAANGFNEIDHRSRFRQRQFRYFFSNIFTRFQLIFRFARNTNSRFQITNDFTFQQGTIMLLNNINRIRRLAGHAHGKRRLIIQRVLWNNRRLLTIDVVTDT